MSLLDELQESLEDVVKKIQAQEQLEKMDIKLLFLKSLIEEETGNVAKSRK